MASPAPTNHFLEHKKIRKKTQNSKIKNEKNIPTNRPPPQAPLLSSYNF
jgi:hypothetical protein